MKQSSYLSQLICRYRGVILVCLHYRTPHPNISWQSKALNKALIIFRSLISWFLNTNQFPEGTHYECFSSIWTKNLFPMEWALCNIFKKQITLLWNQSTVLRINNLCRIICSTPSHRYPSLFKSYIKDSRIYYKLIYSPRPKCMSRLEDVDALAEKLRLASLNGTLPRPPEIKLFRSGTVFPWEVYQYNRTRLIMQTLAN